MLNHLLQDAERNGGDVGTHQSALRHVVRRADGCGDDLDLLAVNGALREIVIVDGRHDVADALDVRMEIGELATDLGVERGVRGHASNGAPAGSLFDFVQVSGVQKKLHGSSFNGIARIARLHAPPRDCLHAQQVEHDAPRLPAYALDRE